MTNTHKNDVLAYIENNMSPMPPAIKHAVYDLPYEVRKKHNQLIQKGFEDVLGRELKKEDLDRLEVASVQGSLTDILKLDGETVGKVRHVHDEESIKVELIKPE